MKLDAIFNLGNFQTWNRSIIVIRKNIQLSSSSEVEIDSGYCLDAVQQIPMGSCACFDSDGVFNKREDH